jgi:hypothetical protein
LLCSWRNGEINAAVGACHEVMQVQGLLAPTFPVDARQANPLLGVALLARQVW